MKRIILFSLMLILFSGFAAAFTDSEILYYWNHNASLGANTSFSPDRMERNNLTVVGSPTFTDSEYLLTVLDSNYIITDQNVDLSMRGSSDRTFYIWLTWISGNTNDYILSCGQPLSQRHFAVYIRTANDFVFSEGATENSLGSVTSGQQRLLVLKKTGNFISAKVNDTQTFNGTFASLNTTLSKCVFGRRVDLQSNSASETTFGQIMILNRSSTNTEDTQVFNNGSKFDHTPSEPPAPPVTTDLETLNATITPTPTADTDTTLVGSCSGASEDNLSFDYLWYKNGEPFKYFAPACYQEQANAATGCGGLSTGNYNPVVDNGQNATVYINYTIPNKFGAATWQVKHGTLETYNVTIPDSCFGGTDLELKFVTQYLIGGDFNYSSQGFCFDGSTWQNITQLDFINTTSDTGGTGNSPSNFYDGDYDTFTWQSHVSNFWRTTGGVAQQRLYEEAIYWHRNQSDDSQTVSTLVNVANITSTDTAKTDTFIFSCRARNTTEVASFFNSSTTTITNSAPQISDLLPVNSTQYDNAFINITYNITDADADSVDCGLYVNDVLNVTSSGVSLTELNSIQPTNLIVGNNVWYLNCTDSESNTISDNRLYLYDPNAPMVFTNFVNRTIYRPTDTVSWQFNFTDQILLFSYNITVDGVQINGTTGINQSSFNITLAPSLASFGAGVHQLGVRVADSHTKNKLEEEYNWNNGLFNNYMQYNFERGNHIRTQSEDYSLGDTWTTIEKEDKWIQIFEPATPRATQVFYESSDSPIQIVGKKGHYNDQWIIVDGHWKDYVLKDEPKAQVIIQRIDDYNVRVRISGILNHPERLEFESLGELNVQTVTYQFSTLNVTATAPATAASLAQQTHTLKINTTAGVTTFANFTYNGTLKDSTKTSLGGYDLYSSTFATPVFDNQTTNVSFVWNYNITGPVNNITDSITDNHLVFFAGIDNCSTFTKAAINFSLIEQTNSSLIQGTMDGDFNIFIDDANSSLNFSLDWSGSSQYGLCLFPPTAVYNFSGTLNAQRLGSTVTKQRLFTNTTISNVSQLIEILFNVNEQRVVFTIIDQDGDPIEEAFITIQEVDIDTGATTLLETGKTDINGVIVAQLVLFDTFYQFDVLASDNITSISSVGPFKVINTVNTIQILLVEDYFSDLNVFNDIIADVSYSKSNKRFSYTFNDPDGTSHEACLKVTKSTINGDTLFNETCTTASAGTLTIDLGSDPDNVTYIAAGKIQINDENFVADLITIDLDTGYLIYGLNGLFVGFLLVLTMSMIGLWSPVVAVVLNTVSVIGLNIFGLFHLGQAALITFIILAGISIWKINKR